MLSSSYVRYADGRLFFNAEYDFQNVEVRRCGGRPISGRPQAWAIECGFVSGPLKVSLAHFYRSGHDRRDGWFNVWSTTGRSPVGGGAWHDRWNFFLTRWGGGQGPIAPYNLLIGVYGTGNNSFNSAGDCTYQDFLAYTARLDYAMAANLNLFASVMLAQRASNTGTPQGIFTGVSAFDRDKAAVPAQPAGLAPNWFRLGNVPDNDLGWELDCGVDWKLLENLTFKFLFARWQPGPWFKWAYQDRSRFNYAHDPVLWTPSINPGRSIDPIVAVQTGFLLEF